VTERDQMVLVCRRNRDLDQENRQLRNEVARLDREVAELQIANANLCIERDTTDHLLGVAMDELREGGALV
jgi:cell division septum initiation protein DivIVA